MYYNMSVTLCLTVSDYMLKCSELVCVCVFMSVCILCKPVLFIVSMMQECRVGH